MKELVGENIVFGRNPAIEVLKSGRTVDKIAMAKGASGSISKIQAMAKEKGIPVLYLNNNELDNIAKSKNHQGVVLFTSPYSYCSIEDILKVAEKKGREPFIILLDGIEDPHNLGAIMRSAEICGADGIIIPKKRSASITHTAIKTSAGASEHIKCAKVSNLVQTIEYLQEKGLWVYQCNMGGTKYYETHMKGGIVLVIGGEGKGVSRLVAEKCDFTVSIPMYGEIYSLNASNAATVIMCEVAKQRNEKVR